MFIDGEPLLQAFIEGRKLFRRFFPKQIYKERDPLNPFWAAVKLVRASDLPHWDRFKKYGHYDTPSYLDYKKEAQRVSDLRRQLRHVLDVQEKLAALNTDELKEYKTEVVIVPWSLRKKRVSFPLPEPVHKETVFKPQYGAEVVDGRLYVWTTWKTQEVHVWLSCPGRILHADEIATHRQWLEARSPEEKAKLRDLETSWSQYPILFISHRWETADHPDPNGHQLRKLRGLKDCFLIYDYSSFPQDSRSPELRLILENMTRLIENVLILASPDYADRGWCLYEYVVASLRVAIVCDEVNDPDFVALRRWCSTHPPVNLSLKGHSVDSTIQNTISKEILEAVNRIRPRYVQSKFTVESDRQLVTDLLVRKLETTLPSRKEYPSGYLGEWVDKKWTYEELAAAFTETFDWDVMNERWDSVSTHNLLRPNELDVPSTIEGAVRKGYAVDRPGPMSTTESLFRVGEALFSRKATRDIDG